MGAAGGVFNKEYQSRLNSDTLVYGFYDLLFLILLTRLKLFKWVQNRAPRNPQPATHIPQPITHNPQPTTRNNNNLPNSHITEKQSLFNLFEQRKFINQTNLLSCQ